MSIDKSLDYEMLKATVLRANELVPEAYGQKLRACEKVKMKICVDGWILPQFLTFWFGWPPYQFDQRQKVVCLISCCQHSFESCKALLCISPVLVVPNLSHPFKLEVDASVSGAGAVLIQEDLQGIDHPICSVSEKFVLLFWPGFTSTKTFFVCIAFFFFFFLCGGE